MTGAPDCPACYRPPEHGRCQTGGCPCEGLRTASAEAQVTARRYHQRKAETAAAALRGFDFSPWHDVRCDCGCRIIPGSGPDYGGHQEKRSAWEDTPETPPLTGYQALTRLWADWALEFEHEGD